MPLVSPTAPMDVLGIVVGLGFVLSFGYWCTDFVLMQRAFAARTDDAARQVPLWAGFGKLGFSMLVVVPGLAAHRLLPGLGHSQRFDQALPAVMRQSYGPAMLGLGLTTIAASLMSALAANVSAFAASGLRTSITHTWSTRQTRPSLSGHRARGDGRRSSGQRAHFLHQLFLLRFHGARADDLLCLRRAILRDLSTRHDARAESTSEAPSSDS